MVKSLFTVTKIKNHSKPPRKTFFQLTWSVIKKSNQRSAVGYQRLEGMEQRERQRVAVSKKTANWAGTFGSQWRIGLDKVIIW